MPVVIDFKVNLNPETSCLFFLDMARIFGLKRDENILCLWIALAVFVELWSGMSMNVITVQITFASAVSTLIDDWEIERALLCH